MNGFRGEMRQKMLYPDNKKFAFTIFDDTDFATLENVAEVYAFLADLGFRTTKSVWPVSGKTAVPDAGSTCDDRNYLAWVLDLQKSGFEIGYHNATYQSSTREETIRAIERFRELFGHYPYAMTNHADSAENIYWGDHRLTGGGRLAYNALTKFRKRGKFHGHDDRSAYFWGDVCREKIRYVGNFDFPGIDTLRACPFMPYHDPKRPYVNYWFALSNGPWFRIFNDCISEEAQDRLEEEGGACIMYTHLSCGFIRKGALDSRFVSLMKRLSRKGGWFVPVSTLLDHLLKTRDRRDITPRERSALEMRWLWHKIRRGPS